MTPAEAIVELRRRGGRVQVLADGALRVSTCAALDEGLQTVVGARRGEAAALLAECGRVRSERRAAALLGASAWGHQRGDLPDVLHPFLSVEVQVAPHTAMAHAVAAQPDGQLPLLVLHQVGNRYAPAVAMVRTADLTGLLAALATPEDAV